MHKRQQCIQGLSQEMIKGSRNLLIVGKGSGVLPQFNLVESGNISRQKIGRPTDGCAQGLGQEMIKGNPKLLIVGPGQSLWSSHNAIWWNTAIFFYVQAENRPSKRGLWLNPLAKSLVGRVSG